MTERYLIITLQPDWKGALRALGQAVRADTYQGEVLYRSVGRLFVPHKAKASCPCVNWPVQWGVM